MVSIEVLGFCFLWSICKMIPKIEEIDAQHKDLTIMFKDLDLAREKDKHTFAPE